MKSFSLECPDVPRSVDQSTRTKSSSYTSNFATGGQGRRAASAAASHPLSAGLPLSPLRPKLRGAAAFLPRGSSVAHRRFVYAGLSAPTVHRRAAKSPRLSHHRFLPTALLARERLASNRERNVNADFGRAPCALIPTGGLGAATLMRRRLGTSKDRSASIDESDVCCSASTGQVSGLLRSQCAYRCVSNAFVINAKN